MSPAPGLFVTGTPRSGTSLLDKLLSAHPGIAVLSQPLPRLYIAVKRAFLTDPSPLEQAFPLNDLFAGTHRPPADFDRHLARAVFDPGWLADTLAAMRGHPAQLVPPAADPGDLVPDRAVGLAEFVAGYLAAHAPPNTPLIGCKEIVAEEFIGHFLDAGTRVLQTIRDPRDVIASAMGGRGTDYAGQGLPLLFLLRQWRKSVAFALHHADHPGLRILRYEDLARDPDTALGPVAGWLGLGPFPAALATRPLTDAAGATWAANSSHGGISGVQATSVGTGTRTLPRDILQGIETVCAPEMRLFGYAPVVGADPGGPGPLTDPCGDPRPALAGYRWDAGALAAERQRLDGLRQGRYQPALHLSERAFDHLTGAAPLPRPLAEAIS